jgi:hypothetical protein
MVDGRAYSPRLALSKPAPHSQEFEPCPSRGLSAETLESAVVGRQRGGFASPPHLANATSWGGRPGEALRGGVRWYHGMSRTTSEGEPIAHAMTTDDKARARLRAKRLNELTRSQSFSWVVRELPYGRFEVLALAKESAPKHS